MKWIKQAEDLSDLSIDELKNSLKYWTTISNDSVDKFNHHQEQASIARADMEHANQLLANIEREIDTREGR